MSTAFGTVPRVRPGSKLWGTTATKPVTPPPPKPSVPLAVQPRLASNDAVAKAWADGFRAAELLHGISVTYGEADFDPPPLTMKEIIRQVAQKYGYTAFELKSARRARGLVRARHEAMWVCRKQTQNSLPQIGRAFGGRDHTTVLHACRRHEERMAKEAEAR